MICYQRHVVFLLKPAIISRYQSVYRRVIMHRVKRPSSKADGFGFSQVQNRTNHENTGGESKIKTGKSRRSMPGFQMNAIGGPLGEEFQERD